ncbi:MAG TPA: serine hydrolase domain-containing protein [Sediminibacterium sp.]|nr:serine hydrolase domain-containing protein [Sediminibacterium sp.]
MKKYRFLLLCSLVGPSLFSLSLAQSSSGALDNWMQTNTPAMGGRALLMLWKNGEPVYSHAVNSLNMRQKLVDRIIARKMGQPADLGDYTPDTRIRMASCSKWLSAALVMRFVDAGQLALTDTVGKYLPVLSAHGKGGITIRQCLSHLTGIKAAALREELEEQKDIHSMEESIERIAALPMEGEPGTVFHYSNIGLQIAGAVLEKISGKGFEELFAEEIAAPLEMEHTDFGHVAVPLPAGGAFSTANDYGKFLQMILQKGIYKGKRILSEAAVAEMQVNRIDKTVRIAYSPAEAGDFGYGYGEWVMESSAETHLSKAVTSPGLFGSFPWVDNARGYCGMLLCFYLKSDGRHERYLALKKLADAAIQATNGN